MDLSILEGKKVFITGATGLIGKLLVEKLLEWKTEPGKEIHVIALARNPEKAERLFGKYKNKKLDFIYSDILDLDIENIDADYIVHGASQTSSFAFVHEPVETIMTALDGTKKLLDLSKNCKAKSFVYLSTMEVYGSPSTDEKIDEQHATNLDTMKTRSCYPESKRMCENMCTCYAQEYGVPAKVLRLTQTFGPGVQYDDGRVFAEFARSVIEDRDIILHTKGETKRCYLYTEDAVDAILTVLIKGNSGEAYNAANEDTYCSIYEMASMVAGLNDKGINVVIKDDGDAAKMGYAPVLKMNLDTSKLQELGWSPKTDLKTMYKNMIEDMNRNKGRN